ncbi:MAG: cellulose binding domain-containing protein, partial [Myxococcota bacterium]
PIDTSGQILNTPNTKGSFNGVRELATLLANSPDVHQCISFQWMRWVYGITKQNKISCAIQDIRKTFDKQDIHALLLGLTQHPHFRQRLSANTTTPPSSEPQDPQEPNPSDAGDPQEPNPSDAGDPPESTDMESPPPEKAPPPPTPKDLQVRVQTDSDWPEGRCQKVSIKNTGTAELEWRIPLRLEFKMKQHWNANMTPTDQKDTFIFSGLMWNRTVRPQQTVQFGYCLTKEPW